MGWAGPGWLGAHQADFAQGSHTLAGGGWEGGPRSPAQAILRSALTCWKFVHGRFGFVGTIDTHSLMTVDPPRS